LARRVRKARSPQKTEGGVARFRKAGVLIGDSTGGVGPENESICRDRENRGRPTSGGRESKLAEREGKIPCKKKGPTPKYPMGKGQSLKELQKGGVDQF